MPLIDRVKYDGPSDGGAWLVYKYPSDNIAKGAKLIVNQSQEAIFFKNGKIIETLTPGSYTLSTENLPFLRMFKYLPYGGLTPFPAEIYFVNKTSKLDLKWGTSDPILIEDPKYSILVNIRAFGQLGAKITDSNIFLISLVGALGEGFLVQYEAIRRYFKGIVISKIKETISKKIQKENTSIISIIADLESLSEQCKTALAPAYDKYGIQILSFYIESINVPEEDVAKVKEILNQKQEFVILGDKRYSTKRMFDYLEKSAGSSNVGNSIVDTGLGLGIGLQISQDIVKQFVKDIKSESSVLECPSCHTANDVSLNFCTKCGALLKNKNCPDCGFENSSNAQFCGNCGKKM